MPKSKSPAREVMYNTPHVKILMGDNPLTSDMSKEFLCWQDEKDAGGKFEKDYLLKDSNGIKIRCWNNINNRPIDNGTIAKLKQEILRKRWFLNMENRIIGRTGLILNGQHTLVALVLAVQDYNNNPDKFPYWDTEPTIETTIAFGCDESDELVNTLDTGRTRSLSDVIYRSGYFQDIPNKDRLKAASCTEHAVKLLWGRTGVPGAFAIRQTHAESIDFIKRHPRIIDAVRFIVEEDKGDKECPHLLSPYISLGYGAAFLYLMAAGSTDPRKYQAADEPNEDDLDFDLWDDAEEFFMSLAQRTQSVDALRIALGALVDEDGASIGEKSALLVKAWACVVDGKNVTAAALKLKYKVDDLGIRHLDECPTVGGIDCGDDGVPEQTPTPKPTKKAVKKKVTKKTAPAKSAKKKVTKKTPKKAVAKKKTVKKAPPHFEKGEYVWVKEEDKFDGDYPVWAGDFVRYTSKTAAEVENSENEIIVVRIRQISRDGK